MAYLIWSIILVGIEGGVILFFGVENLLGIGILSIFILAFLFCRTMIFSGAVPKPPMLTDAGKPVVTYSDMKEIKDLDTTAMQSRHEMLRSKALDHIILIMIVLNIIAVVKIA